MTVLPVAVIAWKPVRKGALRGFATVRLGRSLVIHDCPVLAGSRGAWAALPGRPVLDSEGRQKRDDRDRPVFAPMAEWSDKAVRTEFSDAVIAAVERDHPGALTGAEP